MRRGENNMNRKTAQKVLALTQECLVKYWQLDSEFVLDYCDQNIIWVGPRQNQFIQGKKELTRTMTAAFEVMKPCHLGNTDFKVVQNSGHACTILGHYFVTADDEAEDFAPIEHRSTFTWEYQDGVFMLRHVHVSEPFEVKTAVTEENDTPSNKAEKMTNQYLKKYIPSADDVQRVIVKDTNGSLHYFWPSEIVYVSARGRNTVIHTISGADIDARLSISQFVEEAGSHFIPIHRSHVVNDAYIISVQKYEVLLEGGGRVPIPVKRYKEIKTRIKDWYDGKKDI